MTTPRIRASDADRQKSVDILARHFTEGRLDSLEYDQRIQKAYACVYLDELAPLFTDLPPEPTLAQNYETAWQRGYGDRPVFSGLRPTNGQLRRVPQIVGFVILAAVMLVLLVESRGFFFPFPLIWIGWFGLSAARRGSRRDGPGPRR